MTNKNALKLLNKIHKFRDPVTQETSRFIEGIDWDVRFNKIDITDEQEARLNGILLALEAGERI